MLFKKKEVNNEVRDFSAEIRSWIDKAVEEIHSRVYGIDPHVVHEHAEAMRKWLWDVWNGSLDSERLVHSGLKHLKWGFDIDVFLETHVAKVFETLILQMLKAGVSKDRIVEFSVNLSKAISEMLKGYFRYSVETPMEETDKLTEELNRVYEEVNNSLSQLHTAYEQIAKASQHIANNVQSLAANSSTSLEVFKKFSDTIKQIMGSIEETANNIRNVINKFDTLSEAFKNIGDTVTSVTEYSKKIDKITDIISDIAEQTNLLALNAAIEAARLGEQGRGFAVVADEIRRLADSVKKSADDISSIVTNSSQQVARLNEVTKTAQQIIKEVSELALKTTSGLESQAELAKKVAPEEAKVKEIYEKMHTQIEEISSATEEQASATEEALSSLETIKEAMENLGKEISEVRNLSSEFRAAVRKIVEGHE